MKKKNSLRVRFLVMLAVLAVVAVGYFTAGGIGNLCGIGFGDITLLCPLGALLAMLAQKTAIPLAVISVIVVLLICIVLGKVFCAWACPVHFMSRLRKGKKSAPTPTGAPLHGAADDSAGPQALRAAQEGVSPVSPCSTCASPCGKSSGIKLDSRHGILAAALGSTLIFGFPVFCLICPVGLTFATVLLGMRLFAFGEATWTIVAFVAIIAVEVLLLPKWCKRFCPLGALLSLFSGLNRTFQPQVNAETCLREGRGKACNLCEKACPEGINLHDIAAGETTLNDCSKCRACADVCPEGAITFPLLPKKKTTASAVETFDADETPERG
jgi:ferredoxin-type protein NapH